MRRLPKILLGLIGVGAAALYAGLPTRVGLTRSQALVSMPGDLVLPTAQLQADRMVTIEEGGRREALEKGWPLLLGLQPVYEDTLGAKLVAVYEDAPNLVVWKTVEPTRDDVHQEDLFSASVAVVARPEGSAVSIHARERYALHGDWRARVAATAAMTATAGNVSPALRRIRRGLTKWVVAHPSTRTTPK